MRSRLGQVASSIRNYADRIKSSNVGPVLAKKFLADQILTADADPEDKKKETYIAIVNAAVKLDEAISFKKAVGLANC
jgi:hypothetical protein